MVIGKIKILTVRKDQLLYECYKYVIYEKGYIPDIIPPACGLYKDILVFHA